MTLNHLNLSGSLIDDEQTGMDLNSTGTVMDKIDLGAMAAVVFAPVLTTGSWGSAVLRAQCSCNGVVWYDISGDVTSETLSAVYTVATRYFRIKVQTASGSAATFSVNVNAKF